DPVAVAHVARPGLVEVRPASIEVDCESEQSRGRTNVDRRGRGPATPGVSVAVGVDAAAFRRLVVERLPSLGWGVACRRRPKAARLIRAAAATRRSRTPRGEVAPMARKKRTIRLRPRKPARLRKRKRRGARSHHHPELAGLATCALGVFLAGVLWFGLSGGPVGHAATAAIGWAAYVLPLALVPVGALVVTRSELVDVRPFRLGLSVGLLGLLLALGRAHGGLLGTGLERVVGLGIGHAGSTILGVLLAVA